MAHIILIAGTFFYSRKLYQEVIARLLLALLSPVLLFLAVPFLMIAGLIIPTLEDFAGIVLPKEEIYGLLNIFSAVMLVLILRHYDKTEKPVEPEKTTPSY